MKIVELVTSARAANHEAFGNVSEARATAIVRAVFHELAQSIDAVESGNLPVVGLGRFVVKQVAVKKGDTKASERRVLFRTVIRAKPTE